MMAKGGRSNFLSPFIYYTSLDLDNQYAFFDKYCTTTSSKRTHPNLTPTSLSTSPRMGV